MVARRSSLSRACGVVALLVSLKASSAAQRLTAQIAHPTSDQLAGMDAHRPAGMRPPMPSR